MSVQNFKIIQGRTYDITVTVSGIASWTDLIAKMYIRKRRDTGNPGLTLTGSINSETDVVTFPITAVQSAGLDAVNHDHEVALYKDDRTVVYAPLTGNILVEIPIVEDPTT